MHDIRRIRLLEIHVLENSSERKKRPLPRIARPKAPALAVSKALLDTRREGVELLADHPLGLERVRVVKDSRVAVHGGQDRDERLVARDLVLAAGEHDGRVVAFFGDGLDVEAWGHAGEAECFAEDGLDVGEAGEVVVFEVGGADDGVEFLLGLADLVGVLHEVVEGEGDEVGRCGAADVDVDDLVKDLAFAEGAAGFRVCAVHERVQHVLFVGRVVAAVLDEGGAEVAHGFDVAFPFALVQEPCEEAGAGWSLERFTGRVGHGCDEGRFRALHAVDALVEEAEGVGFVVESVEVVGDVDALARACCPLFDQVGGGFADAAVQEGSRFGRCQRRHDTVGDSPNLHLVMFGREEAVVHGGADLDDGAGHAFAESLLVTDFFQEGGACDEDDVVSEDADFEDGA